MREVAVLSTDLTVLTLVASGAILTSCIAIMAATMPDPRLGSRRPWWRRRRVRRSTASVGRDVVVATYLRDRNPVTGPRPSLPRALQSATVPRQTAPTPDVRGATGDVERAEMVIDYLLDTDPDVLAEIMMEWMRNDPEHDPMDGLR